MVEQSNLKDLIKVKNEKRKARFQNLKKGCKAKDQQTTNNKPTDEQTNNE